MTDRTIEETKENGALSGKENSVCRPHLWPCGWAEISGRCVRLHCNRSTGPCDGYDGD